jgi:hypothetical protein
MQQVHATKWYVPEFLKVVNSFSVVAIFTLDGIILM